MVEVDKGYKALAFIITKEDTFTNLPPLGTDKDEPSATAPTAANYEKIVGITSFPLPWDNQPIDLPEVGTRIIQRTAGGLNLAGRIEKWKQDAEWIGASMGFAEYESGPKTTYKKADDFLKFDIVVYEGVPLANRETAYTKKTTLSALDTYCGTFKARYVLKNVKFGSYESSIEPNAAEKETINWTCEEIEVLRQ